MRPVSYLPAVDQQLKATFVGPNDDSTALRFFHRRADEYRQHRSGADIEQLAADLVIALVNAQSESPGLQPVEGEPVRPGILSRLIVPTDLDWFGTVEAPSSAKGAGREQVHASRRNGQR